MYAEERQQAIVQRVVEHGRMSVNALADLFSVTTETVRRDLSTLERLGLLRRVHGGVVPAHTLAAVESALGERDQVKTPEKDLIARKALDFLPADGATVIIDAGSTASRFAAMLPRDRQLVVFTHALTVASALASHPHIELHLLPGRVRRTTQAAVGADTVAALSDLRVDAAFVGANGLTVGHGLTTPDRDEAAVKRAIVGSTARAIALCDASKIGEEAPTRFATISDLDTLITDDSITDIDRKEIDEAGMHVVIA